MVINVFKSENKGAILKITSSNLYLNVIITYLLKKFEFSKKEQQLNTSINIVELRARIHVEPQLS